MKIMISPAKKMNQNGDTLDYRGKPFFLHEANQILQKLKTLSYLEAKNVWKCSDKIAQEVYENISKMNFDQGLSPAILSYEGIQYQHMGPEIMEENMLAYIEKHVRILSGFYGILRPFDGICPYRLEMQAKLGLEGSRNLYDFWKDKLYRRLKEEDKKEKNKTILNLASKEYAKCITPYVQEEDTFVDVLFVERIEGKLVQKGTLAKMARGDMVRFMAENQIENLEDLKNFSMLHFSYQEDLSNKEKMVFLRKKKA